MPTLLKSADNSTNRKTYIESIIPYPAICAIFILCFSVMSSLNAQQTKLVLPGIENRDNPSNFELIDLTGDSLVLGYLKTTPASNDRQAIVAPVSKQRWLQNVVTDKISEIASNPAIRILYILHDISVGRIRNGNYVRIKAAVYAGTRESYMLVRQADTLVTDKGGDINSVGKLITAAVGTSISITTLTNFTGSNLPGQSEISFTRTQAIQREKESYNFITRNFTPTGIYMTYEEFKTSRPSFDRFFIKINKSGSKPLPDVTDSDAPVTSSEDYTLTINSLVTGDSTMRPVTPWAIAVNNEVYIYRDGKLYAIESFGNNLAFSKFINPETRKNNAAFWRITVGNNLSGKYSNVFDDVNTLVLNNYQGRNLTGEAIKINADTGEAAF